MVTHHETWPDTVSRIDEEAPGHAGERKTLCLAKRESGSTSFDVLHVEERGTYQEGVAETDADVVAITRGPVLIEESRQVLDPDELHR